MNLADRQNVGNRIEDQKLPFNKLLLKTRVWRSLYRHLHNRHTNDSGCYIYNHCETV